MKQGINLDCAACRVSSPVAGVLAARLRLAGHQVTAARAAVLAAVATRVRPFTAGDLCSAVAASAPTVGRATVFRTLDLLVAEGLLDRLYSLGPHVSYVSRHPQRPDAAGAQGTEGTDQGTGRALYLVCAACHGVQEIEDGAAAAALRQALSQAAARHAWPAEGALVEIKGRCPAC